MEQDIEQSDYINVIDKANSLGCSIPTDFAFLPRNFEEAVSRQELVHETLTIEIRKALREKGIKESRLEREGERYPTVLERAGDFVVPTVFISMFLSQNPEVLSIVINVISNYIYDFLKNKKSRDEITFSAVFEISQRKKYLKIDYKGTESAMDKIKPIIESIKKDG